MSSGPVNNVEQFVIQQGKVIERSLVLLGSCDHLLCSGLRFAVASKVSAIDTAHSQKVHLS